MSSTGTTSTTTGTVPRILVVGGGYVGLYTALRLTKKLQRGEATVTVVDPRSYMTYQPFLPEASAGSIQPRHTVVPLRQTLTDAEVITGWVTGVEHARKVATVQPLEGEPYELAYDVLVMAVGSVARTLPIPGLAEWASGFKNVTIPLTLPGIAINTSPTDYYPIQAVQLARFKGESFDLFGEVMHAESS